MSNHDELILKIFFLSDKLNISVINKYNRKKNVCYENIKYYLLHRYIDTETERESLYRIKYNIEDRPTCKECGKKVKFVGKGGKMFASFCSYQCMNRNKDVLRKKQESDRKRNNGKLGWNINTIEKIQHRKNSLINKYGSWENACKEIDNLRRLGVFKKYGVKSAMELDSVQIKRNKSLRKNKKSNTSKEEDIVYNFLVQYFPDIIRSYSSEKYRWNCDFYIPSLDVYIEYNGSHYHNFSPFMNTEEDKNKLNELINKSNKIKESRSCSKTQYDMIIYTWTDLDVRKRHTAKENNLKFIEIWNLNELCDELIDKIENKKGRE